MNAEFSDHRRDGRYYWCADTTSSVNCRRSRGRRRAFRRAFRLGASGRGKCRAGLVSWIRSSWHVRRPSEFIRLGAGRAVMLEHHKRRATTPGGSEGRPPGRFSRPLGGRGGAPRICNRGDTPRWPPGASGRLADAKASPAPPFLPSEREKRSYMPRTSDPGH